MSNKIKRREKIIVRQIHIFFIFSKAYRQFVWLFTGFVRVLKKSKPKTAQESKQKQFHVCKSYKTHESTLPCIGNSEENIDLSCIYLASQMNAQPKTENLSFFLLLNQSLIK